MTIAPTVPDYSSSHNYRPGQYDRFLPQSTRPNPDDISGVSVSLAASGAGIVLTEALRSGANGPRRLLDLSEPYDVFIKLADGREVWIEVRLIAALPDEDHAPWEIEAGGEMPDIRECAPVSVSVPAAFRPIKLNPRRP